MYELGGHAVVLTLAGQPARARRAARATPRACSPATATAIVLRTFGQDASPRSPRASPVPVINGLTDQHHPCQVATDLFTVRERVRRGSTDLRYAWIGDGNNMAHSWIEAAGLFGLDLALACPEATSRPGARRRGARAPARARRRLDRDHRRPARGGRAARTCSPPTCGRRWGRRTRPRARKARSPATASTTRCSRTPRPTRSSCTACPRTAARRSPATCSRARARSPGCRRRTACTSESHPRGDVLEPWQTLACGGWVGGLAEDPSERGVLGTVGCDRVEWPGESVPAEIAGIGSTLAKAAGQPRLRSAEGSARPRGVLRAVAHRRHADAARRPAGDRPAGRARDRRSWQSCAPSARCCSRRDQAADPGAGTAAAASAHRQRDAPADLAGVTARADHADHDRSAGARADPAAGPAGRAAEPDQGRARRARRGRRARRSTIAGASSRSRASSTSATRTRCSASRRAPTPSSSSAPTSSCRRRSTPTASTASARQLRDRPGARCSRRSAAPTRRSTGARAARTGATPRSPQAAADTAGVRRRAVRSRVSARGRRRPRSSAMKLFAAAVRHRPADRATCAARRAARSPPASRRPRSSMRRRRRRRARTIRRRAPAWRRRFAPPASSRTPRRSSSWRWR